MNHSGSDAHLDNEERERLERIYGPAAAQRGWDPDIWVRMWRIAHRLSYPHLALAWLSSDLHTEPETDLSPRREAEFHRSLRAIADISREELLDFFYEIGPERAHHFVARYRHLSDPDRPTTAFL